MLGALVTSAFFVRHYNYSKYVTKRVTIDEVVYYRMAEQILTKISDYNTIPYGKDLSSKGRVLPKYFFQPLFKHPPVFTYLVALSMKLFGANWYAAGYVPVLLGSLMIALIYLLGAMLFNRQVGFLSAIFLWLDPANILCSQKLWMDTPIAFFTLLSTTCFIYAIKNKKDLFFLLSGIAAGLAVNTKYTGILVNFAIILYSLIYARELFRNKKFLIGIVSPYLMLLPWFAWNLSVYKITSVLNHSELNVVFARVLSIKTLIAGLVFVLIAFVLKKIVLIFKSKTKTDEKVSASDGNMLKFISMVFSLSFLIVFLKDNIISGFNLFHIPSNYWYGGQFVQFGGSFYFGRLIEFSLIYVLGIFSLFSFDPKENKEIAILRMTAGVILVFFILWGNYQTRYILSVTPYLIFLGIGLWDKLLDKCMESERFSVYFGLRLALKVFLFYVICKMYYLDMIFAFGGDTCYF